MMNVILTVLVAFLLTLWLGRIVIPALRALKAGSPDFKIRYQNYSNKYNLA